jgi:hypothetical protein
MTIYPHEHHESHEINHDQSIKWTYPLGNMQKTMENHHFLWGFIHYFYGGKQITDLLHESPWHRQVTVADAFEVVPW